MANNFADKVNELLNEVQTELNQDVERGLDKASDYLTDKLKAATPTKTGKTRQSWVRTTKYKRVRYVGNTATNERNIPTVNLLEYSRKGNPFVRKTFEANKQQILKILTQEVSK